MMLCSHICKKGNQNVFRTGSCGYVQRVPTIKLWNNAWKSSFGPISNEELSDEYSNKALEEMNTIKEKRCGNIKGRIFEMGVYRKVI